MSDKKSDAKPLREDIQASIDEEIRKAVSKIQFGVVQLIIQDGRIVQIDTTEKRRLV